MNRSLVEVTTNALPRAARLLSIGLLFCLLVALPTDTAWSCPNCRDALADAGRALGYAGGILLMLFAPFGIASFWAVVIYRLRKGLGA